MRRREVRGAGRVNPIVAIILMVAITMVLAWMLSGVRGPSYTMATALAEFSGYDPSTVNLTALFESWNDIENVTASTYANRTHISFSIICSGRQLWGHVNAEGSSTNDTHLELRMDMRSDHSDRKDLTRQERETLSLCMARAVDYLRARTGWEPVAVTYSKWGWP